MASEPDEQLSQETQWKIDEIMRHVYSTPWEEHGRTCQKRYFVGGSGPLFMDTSYVDRSLASFMVDPMRAVIEAERTVLKRLRIGVSNTVSELDAAKDRAYQLALDNDKLEARNAALLGRVAVLLTRLEAYEPKEADDENS